MYIISYYIFSTISYHITLHYISHHIICYHITLTGNNTICMIIYSSNSTLFLRTMLRMIHNSYHIDTNVVLHAKPRIPGGEKSIFTVVIH